MLDESNYPAPPNKASTPEERAHVKEMYSLRLKYRDSAIVSVVVGMVVVGVLGLAFFWIWMAYSPVPANYCSECRKEMAARAEDAMSLSSFRAQPWFDYE